jgi:tetratricopeptide (TPR) repeat protein
MDRNDLVNCRNSLGKARTIYSVAQANGSKSAKDSLTWLLHSLGNLESADGNIDTALRFFAEADAERRKETPIVAWREALADMTAGRAFYLKGEYSTALARFDKAKKTFKNDSTWMG